MKWSGRIHSWPNLRQAYYFGIFMEELWKRKEYIHHYFQSPVPNEHHIQVDALHSKHSIRMTMGQYLSML
jgi:hypothetical protein